ncbi:MAG: hypothetical protein P4K93_09350 [Terracidiphilus sp.]|nr:hypothetical protein [Terracidiphilus sp.]MDR3798346.1 hypothetical protein [Terracidiphilus sp.]
MPAHGPQSTAAKEQPAPAAKKTATFAPLTGSNPGNDSRGYDFGVFDLPDRAEIPRGTDGKETETIEIRNFGRHVRAQVENALNRSPQEGFNALFRAIGTARGAELMSAPALKKFEELGHGFLSSKNPKLFFTTELVSFLNSLTPEKRKK